MQADAELTFPEGGSAKGDSQSQYRKKPEIKVTTVLAFFTMIFRDSGGIHFAIITELQKEECRGRIVSGALLRMCAFVVSLIVCSQHSFSEVTEVEVSDREAINSSKKFPGRAWGTVFMLGSRRTDGRHAQLSSGVRLSVACISCRLLSGTWSCGLDVLQTDHMFGAMVMSNF